MEFRGQYQSAKIKIRKILFYFWKISVEELVAYMVAVCSSYLFACGKTRNMQLSEKNLPLQAIWLEVNWSMSDSIYSVSRWLIFFCCCFDIHVTVLVSLLIRTFAFMFTRSCFMAKSIVWHNITSKQDRHFIVLFWTVISFNRLNVNMLFLFVCLLDCKYLLFRFVSDTLAGDFLSTQLIYRGKVELCHYPLYDVRGKESK